MKRKFKIMNHQIEQLKEEIQAKDHALVKEHFEHKKVDRELESLKTELTELRQKVKDGEETIDWSIWEPAVAKSWMLTLSRLTTSSRPLASL
jgi:predicted  nucleic acid-binding Zn-ribbon protein